MKLPRTVMNAMRGIGAATVLATAAAGCGGAQETRSTGLVAHESHSSDASGKNRNQEPQTDEISVQPSYDYDVAVACGRG